VIAVVLIVVLTLAVPAAAGAATVSVAPYVEPPGTDPFGSCSRYMMCPPDMIVVAGGPNENNAVVITAEGSVPAEGGARPRSRFIVRDRIAQVQAGPGCSQIDFQAVSCTAGAVGPVRLGDGDDWFASALGATDVHGGAGQDVLQDMGGHLTGGAGDDVIVGGDGTGGGGHDVLTVSSGAGGSGDDVLRCFPRAAPCNLDGGPGDDLLTGGTSVDRIFGRGGDDRLVGGADGDRLHGGAGADALISREDRSAKQRIELDRVDCGRGRRDRAVADRRDEVRRSCERVALPG
jgi:RTX calcium-binding nonapeptide repeat (4 copies)